ncbi:MAG: DUF4143 domain-containing protein, partial [Candidatus Sulfotelmatobacter sp.]
MPERLQRIGVRIRSRERDANISAACPLGAKETITSAPAKAVAHEQVKRGNFLYQGLNEFILDPLYHGVRRPIRYLSDTGLLCALLNLRSEEALRQSPAVGAVWETFVFAQLRDCERRGGRTGSLFFWRDRTREVDFVVDTGGCLELFEVKWTELPDVGDTVNLDFVRNVVGKSRVAGGAVVCRTPNGFPLPNG